MTRTKKQFIISALLFAFAFISVHDFVMHDISFHKHSHELILQEHKITDTQHDIHDFIHIFVALHDRPEISFFKLLDPKPTETFYPPSSNITTVLLPPPLA